jgi:plastocyanin domain-containing protein
MHALRLALFAIAPIAAACTPANAETAASRDVAVHVTMVYDPSSIQATAGEHLRLVFTRDAEGCTSTVVFPSLGLERDLPMHQAVTVDLGMVHAGEIQFRCGMDMVRGKVIVKAKE